MAHHPPEKVVDSRDSVSVEPVEIITKLITRTEISSCYCKSIVTPQVGVVQLFSPFS